MLASLLALAVTKGGLIPNEITALGIKISTFERVSLLYLLALALLYFMLGFILYAAADLKAYRIKVSGVARSRRRYIEETLGPAISRRKTAVSKAVDDRDYSELEKLAQVADISQLAEDVLSVARLRYLFEYYLPIAVGAGALALTLAETWDHPGSLLMTTLVVGVGISMVVGYFWQARKRLKQKWQARKRGRPMRRLQKLTKRLKNLPADSEKREKVMADLRKHLDEMGNHRDES